jgi:hypothetical protein
VDDCAHETQEDAVADPTRLAGRTRMPLRTYLAAWFYRPARRALPHPAAVMVTFTASGLVHNLLAALLSHRLNPFVTVLFMVYGAVTVASEALHLDLSRLPAPARMVVNLASLIGCYKLVSFLLPSSVQCCIAGGQQS